jgi:hypothetical protein
MAIGRGEESNAAVVGDRDAVERARLTDAEAAGRFKDLRMLRIRFSFDPPAP